jgi:hypothetical protein
MVEVLRYRGKVVTETDVVFIRELIAAHPTVSRRALSKLLCEAWEWRQDNGQLRDMVCRSLMLELHRAGHIKLPPVRWRNPNPLANRRRPNQLFLIDDRPIEGPLADLQPLDFVQVRRTGDEPLFNSLLESRHYLHYTQPVGEHLKYLIYARGRPIACMAWSSAPRHLGPRDRFIGWTPEKRRKHINLIAYNSRFLIMSWVRVPHLASHILGRMTKLLPREWERVYHHRVYFLETFVDPERFRGTCYRAANWIYLGKTTGRGKDDLTHKPNRSLKEVWGYPLTKRFRQKLCGEPM